MNPSVVSISQIQKDACSGPAIGQYANGMFARSNYAGGLETRPLDLFGLLVLKNSGQLAFSRWTTAYFEFRLLCHLKSVMAICANENQIWDFIPTTTASRKQVMDARSDGIPELAVTAEASPSRLHGDFCKYSIVNIWRHLSFFGHRIILASLWSLDLLP
ncbi:MAG: hypothetical protein V2A79_14935 [Planctomycetota bacterium]